VQVQRFIRGDCDAAGAEQVQRRRRTSANAEVQLQRCIRHQRWKCRGAEMEVLWCCGAGAELVLRFSRGDCAGAEEQERNRGTDEQRNRGAGA
jgi:hypothetical protein